MTEIHKESADELIRYKHEIARAAVDHLLTSDPKMRERFPEDTVYLWEEHFHHRMLELSEAISTGEPALFSAQIVWAQSAISARSTISSSVMKTIVSLRAGIESIVPTDMRAPITDCIDAALAALSDVPTETWDSVLDPENACHQMAITYLDMVLSGQIREAGQFVADGLTHGLTAKDIYLDVLLPAQHEIGRRWHLNEASVAEEHLVTSTTQRVMAIIAERAPAQPSRHRTVVASTVAGNRHDVGLRALAYLLELDGWRTIFLGADLNGAHLTHITKNFDADVLLLSVALTRQLRVLKNTITAVRAATSHDLKILVGGRGLKNLPGVWRSLGADGYGETAEDALGKIPSFFDSK